MFYKIKALAESGRKIILHYFDYKSKPVKEIETYCYRIFSYARHSGIKGFSFSLPYIVSSRINKELIARLNEDDYPILLEGIHCSGVLRFLKEDRKVVVRMHNNEPVYYSHLAYHANSFLKKTYYNWESKQLSKYQQCLNKNIHLACLSEHDCEILKADYGFLNTFFIPCFIPQQELSGLSGKSNYCLYHGNMQVEENEEAAIWLVRNVFSKVQTPLIIAGKGISTRLTKATTTYRHIQLLNNPSKEKLESLITNAHLNVLPSLNKTGIKLKLLHALFSGRFCITNSNGMLGAGLTNEAFVCEQPNEWIGLISELLLKEYDQNEVEKRKRLTILYNNQLNAAKLNALL